MCYVSRDLIRQERPANRLPDSLIRVRARMSSARNGSTRLWQSSWRSFLQCRRHDSGAIPKVINETFGTAGVFGKNSLNMEGTKMRKSVSVKVLLVAVLFGVLRFTATADTLKLKDGRALEGTFQGGTASVLKFAMSGTVHDIPVETVLSLLQKGVRSR